MNDHRKIIRDEETQLILPPVDLAWEDMKKKLDKESPDKIVYWWKSSFGKRVAGVLALLILLITASVYVTNISVQNNNLANKSELNEDKKTEESAIVDTETKKTTVDDTVLNQNLIKPDGISVPADKNITDQENLTDRNRSSSAYIKTGIYQNNKSGTNNRKIFKKSQKKKPALPDVNQSISSFDSAVGNDLVSFNVNGDSLRSDNSKTLPGTDSAKSEKTDSSASPATEPLSEEWVLESGVHWTLPVPATGSGTYFMGPNGKSQAYRILLPGLWLQARTEKHLMTFELNPFAVGLPPQKSFRTINSLDQLPDTIVTVTDTRTILKTFGFSAGLGYQYNIIQNWWLGGSFQTSWWSRGVAESESVINKVPIGTSTGTYTNNNYTYSIKDEWSYFNRFQLNLNAESVYRRKNWQAVLRLGFAATPFAEKQGPVHPFRGELIYRWRLFDLPVKE